VIAKDGLPIVACASQPAWDEWLTANHASARGVWLQLAKKGAGVPSVTFPEALESALCFGWIDGLSNSFDERSYLQRFTPRGPRSRWSQINREHVERLTAAGRMRPAGLAQVEAAKADGRWAAAYEPPSRMVVPDDLQAALAATPAAEAAFAALSRADRFTILSRLRDVKRPETRARRIAQVVHSLAEARPPAP